MSPSPGIRTRLPPSATVLVVTLALAASASATSAQSDAAPGADTPEAAVRGIFEAMQAGDSAAARRYLHPEARLHRPVPKDGETALQVSSVGGWLQAIGRAEPGQLREEIWGLEIRRDGDLATAWMQYAFYLDGELHHCGVNAFHLARTGVGWQAFVVSDTSRQQGCDGPPAGGNGTDRSAGGEN